MKVSGSFIIIFFTFVTYQFKFLQLWNEIRRKSTINPRIALQRLLWWIEISKLNLVCYEGYLKNCPWIDFWWSRQALRAGSARQEAERDIPRSFSFFCGEPSPGHVCGGSGNGWPASWEPFHRAHCSPVSLTVTHQGSRRPSDYVTADTVDESLSGVTSLCSLWNSDRSPKQREHLSQPDADVGNNENHEDLLEPHIHLLVSIWQQLWWDILEEVRWMNESALFVSYFLRLERPRNLTWWVLWMWGFFFRWNATKQDFQCHNLKPMPRKMFCIESFLSGMICT